MPSDTVSLEDIFYTCSPQRKSSKKKKSIQVYGLDTEAYRSGQCFMLATSEGDVFTPDKFPGCFFGRKYRSKNFVVYNLSYDAGAILQQLPLDKLNDLRKGKHVLYKDYIYHSIPKKCLSISRKGHTIHIYDMHGFYEGKLEYNAEKYLAEHKDDLDPKKFTKAFVKANWDLIAKYCIHDAHLVCKLAELLIKKFESWGVYPQKLYSTAYVSYQYFKTHTRYVTVERYWQKYPKVLYYAMQSYNGGKFEVTEKGTGHFYEYDIISAYPYEIANLLDISHAHVVDSKQYKKSADYGFLRIRGKIPVDLHSPVVIKRNKVNTYPAGYIERVITKKEYEYLTENGATLEIIDAIWLFCNYRSYPYRKAIKELIKYKNRYKVEHKDLDYHTIKIFLNSLYGKFVQLIDKGKFWHATTCWNPIYGSIITANVRVRISAMQQKHPDIIAVHTDSIISKKSLPITHKGSLGDFIYETAGPGIIIGSGIYQIGDKVKFRGYSIPINLIEAIDRRSKYLIVKEQHSYTWRETVFRKWNPDKINKFKELPKRVHVNFDQKRIWLNDYKYFSDMLKRNVISTPLYTHFGDF